MIKLTKDEKKYLPTLEEIAIGDFFIASCLPDRILIKMGDVNDKGWIPCEYLSNRGLGQMKDYYPYLSYAPTTRVHRIEINEIKYSEYSLVEGEED